MFDEVWWFEHGETVKKTAKKAAYVVCGIAIAGGIWGLTRSGKTAPPPEITRQAREARAKGDYDLALKLVEEGEKKDAARGPWSQMKREMNANLRVEFRLEYLPRQRGRAVAGGSELRLSTEDPYYFVVTPTEECYLYLFQIDSAGRLAQVFPNRKNSLAKNPVPPGRQRIPSGAEWLRVSPQPGTEQVVLVAAKWELPEVERVAAEAAAEKIPAEQKRRVERFLARVAKEDRFAPDLPGLVYGSERIVNSGAPPEPRSVAEPKL